LPSGVSRYFRRRTPPVASHATSPEVLPKSPRRTSRASERIRSAAAESVRAAARFSTPPADGLSWVPTAVEHFRAASRWQTATVGCRQGMWGAGWATLHDGKLEGMLHFHRGDESGLGVRQARRVDLECSPTRDLGAHLHRERRHCHDLFSHLQRPGTGGDLSLHRHVSKGALQV